MRKSMPKRGGVLWASLTKSGVGGPRRALGKRNGRVRLQRMTEHVQACRGVHGSWSTAGIERVTDPQRGLESSVGNACLCLPGHQITVEWKVSMAIVMAWGGRGGGKQTILPRPWFRCQFRLFCREVSATTTATTHSTFDVCGAVRRYTDQWLKGPRDGQPFTQWSIDLTAAVSTTSL